MDTIDDSRGEAVGVGLPVLAFQGLFRWTDTSKKDFTLLSIFLQVDEHSLSFSGLLNIVVILRVLLTRDLTA